MRCLATDRSPQFCRPYLTTLQPARIILRSTEQLELVDLVLKKLRLSLEFWGTPYLPRIDWLIWKHTTHKSHLNSRRNLQSQDCGQMRGHRCMARSWIGGKTRDRSSRNGMRNGDSRTVRPLQKNSLSADLFWPNFSPYAQSMATLHGTIENTNMTTRISSVPVDRTSLLNI